MVTAHGVCLLPYGHRLFHSLSGLPLHFIHFPGTYVPGNSSVALRAIKYRNFNNHASDCEQKTQMQILFRVKERCLLRIAKILWRFHFADAGQFLLGDFY